jgi:hypothetical protein
MDGDVRVASGATLTVAANTVVQPATTDSANLGVDPNMVELIVAGTLRVNGESGYPLTFSAASGTGVTWRGISVLAGATITMERADIANALIAVDSANGGTFTDLDVTDSDQGARITGGTADFDRFTVTGGSRGLEARGGTTNVSSSSILGMTKQGMTLISSADSSPTVHLASSTVAGSFEGDAPAANGIRVGGTGGSPVLTVSNSTISDNEGDGVTTTLGTLSVASSTLTHNAGFAMSSAGTPSLDSSILANSGATGDSPDCDGRFTSSSGNNLVENDSGCLLTGTTTGNIVGQDPALADLEDNGGTAPTHALLPGSPAIDVVAGATSPEDQRGISRPADGNLDGTAATDIGAYELLSRIDGYGYKRVLVTQNQLVKGVGLRGASEVRFRGGVSTTDLTVVGEREIDVRVPIGALTGKIRVQLPDGVILSPTKLLVSPWVQDVEPFSAPRGSEITISGYAFTGAKHVTVGGIEADFTVDSYSKITATVPTNARTGYTRLKVTTPGGTNSSPRFRVI